MTALAELQSELKSWAAQHSTPNVNTFMLLLFAVPPLLLLSATGGVARPALGQLFLTWVLIVVVWQTIRKRNLRRFTSRIRDSLREGTLFERIALEGMPEARAVDYIPFPFHLLFPRLRHSRTKLVDEMKMVGSNLDWYLQPPRELLRIHWFAAIIGPAGFIGMLVTSQLMISLNPSQMHQLPLFNTVQAGLEFVMMLAIALSILNTERETIARAIFAEEFLKRMDGLDFTSLTQRPPAHPTTIAS